MSAREDTAHVEVGVANQSYTYDEAYAQQHDEHQRGAYAGHVGVVQNPYGPALNMDGTQAARDTTNAGLQPPRHYAEGEGSYESAAAAAAAAAHHQQILLHHHSQEQQAQHAAHHAHASSSSLVQRAPAIAAAATPSSSSGSGTKRKQVKNACVNCARACKKCDEARPCERCTKLGIDDTCANSPRKERPKGVKRGPYKKKRAIMQLDSTLLATAATPTSSHSHAHAHAHAHEYQAIQQQHQLQHQHQLLHLPHQQQHPHQQHAEHAHSAHQ